MDSLGQPPWDDAGALVEYVRQSADADLGDGNRMWLVDKSITCMRRCSSVDYRELYRNAAIIAINVGRGRVRAVDFTWWIERLVMVRVAYIRLSDKSAEWQESEVRSVFEDFLNLVGMTAGEMENCLSGVRDMPFNAGLSGMRELADAIGHMRSVLSLLPPLDRSRVEEWLRMEERIRSWRSLNEDSLRIREVEWREW